MSEALEFPPGALLPVFPGRLTTTGLSITAPLSFSCWEEIVHRIAVMNECSSWWLGDALLYGERQYGEMYTQAIEATGRAYQTLANYVFTCRAIPAEQRRDDLSFTHHAELASIKDASERAEWLRRAAENDWSVSQLRKARQEHREATEPATVPHPAVQSMTEIVRAFNAGGEEVWRQIIEAFAGLAVPVAQDVQSLGKLIELKTAENQPIEDAVEDDADPFCDDNEPNDPEPVCEWRIIDKNWSKWLSACGHAFNFASDGPNDSGFKFCPYCGAELVEAVGEEDVTE